jgi:hypothetical protein
VSDGGAAFVKAMGRPDPRTGSELPFTSGSLGARVWDRLYPEIGAGYYRDRFLFLFGEGLTALRPCLDAWSFLLPGDVTENMIIGRNAYGALLVLENPNQFGPKERVSVLDPLAVAYRRYADLDFVGLIGYWLPENELPQFLDQSVYDDWRRQTRSFLEPGQILAPKTPLGMGGAMELGNFQVEDIVSYYQTTAPIYRKAFAKGDGARIRPAAAPEKRSTPKPTKTPALKPSPKLTPKPLPKPTKKPTPKVAPADKRTKKRKGR